MIGENGKEKKKKIYSDIDNRFVKLLVDLEIERAFEKQIK